MSETGPVDHPPWPLRALLLLALGAALGLAIHLLTRGPVIWQWTENPARLGVAAALAAGGFAFALTLERSRWLWSVLFAAGAGLVVGFVTYWNGQPNSWGAGESWQLVSALLALAIAAPLFQASRDSGRWNLDYGTVHAHILTNIVLWVVAWGFVLVTFLLIVLLANLFKLIGLAFLDDLLEKPWALWILIGGAFGAAVGLLRDRDRIVDTVQRVATSILSFLAPILAAGLVLFVLALPFTGLQPLWDQTQATTPILLACIAGAVVLINAVIGSGSNEDEERARPIRWAAAALAEVVLPLAIVAAISTGKRIAQHGFTPDRLWAAVFVGIAVAGAAAYCLALIRGRAGWAPLLRTLNVRIAIGICLIALFLALPIVGFGAISTRDQVARLQSGRIAPDRFDWAALRFDFGPPGRRALERLARSGNAVVRDNARAALAAGSRRDARREIQDFAEAPREIRHIPAGAVIPDAMRAAVLGRPGNPGACTGKGECYLYWRPGEDIAIVILDDCSALLAVDRGSYCSLNRIVLARSGAAWFDVEVPGPTSRSQPVDQNELSHRELRDQLVALRRGEMEVRAVSRRQVHVGGKPVGKEF